MQWRVEKKKEALQSPGEVYILHKVCWSLNYDRMDSPSLDREVLPEKYKKCDLEEFAEAEWASDGSGQHLAFKRSLYREENKVSLLAQAVWTLPTRSLIVDEQQTIVPAGKERA